MAKIVTPSLVKKCAKIQKITTTYRLFASPKSNTFVIHRTSTSTSTTITIMHPDIEVYNNKQTASDREICNALATTIDSVLKESESKIWHAHPVWFLDGNPIVGYSKLKESVRLLFWSGQSFDEPQLTVEGKFKAAEMRYTSVDQVHVTDLKRWLKKSRDIQWDYKNIVKRKGKLERLK